MMPDTQHDLKEWEEVYKQYWDRVDKQYRERVWGTFEQLQERVAKELFASKPKPSRMLRPFSEQE
jgi:pyridoxine/pyridoxamine 5'-phosphate oxidase